MGPRKWFRKWFSRLHTFRRGIGWVEPLNRSRHCFAFPRVESLEDRLAPAGNLTLTDALLVDGNNLPITAPNKGEMVFLRAEWFAQGLASDDSYRISYSVDGVVLSTIVLTDGAGNSFGQSANWYLGGWYATPGVHDVTVTIDLEDNVAESNEADNALSFRFTPVTAPDFPRKLELPLAGTPFQTWNITNYLDVDPRSGSFNDYAGKQYTYDAHQGWDIGPGNFGAMDDGLAVYAAAPGTVHYVQDGNFDRNTSSSSSPANYIDIDMGNGWHAFYYHLRTNTILVREGEAVASGQMLGMLGSSGDSTAAHLHFAVYHNGGPVETSLDASTYWANPLPFQGDVSSVSDSAVTLHYDTLTADLDAKERPVSANTFTQASGQQLSVWFSVFSRTDDAVAIKFYEPDGTLYPLSASLTIGESHGGYHYLTFPLPDGLTLGTWHVGIEFNGVELARDAFHVTADGAGAARVTEGTTYLPNGRTTPIDFGAANPGDSPPQLSFTIENLGSAALRVSDLTLPEGFSLVGSFPSSIGVGSSASFTVRLDTASSGARAGILSFTTDDPNAPTYAFNAKGIVSGGDTGALHGQLYHDVRGDALENGADEGLRGWTVHLLDRSSDSVLAATTTGFDGYYAFLNLAAGDYRVRVTPPLGWRPSRADPADVTVTTSDVLASPIGMTVQHPLSPVGTPSTYAGTFQPKPSASDNEAFIKGLYQSTLLRAPSPAEVDAWLANLNGGQSRASVANGFINSVENRTSQVAFFYQYFLSRSPDPTGLAGWVAALQSGVDEGTVMSGFVLSPEFTGQTTNSQFVTLMYSLILGRQADPSGFSGWTANLSSGQSRDSVVSGILRSTESLQRVVASDFASYLKRAADIAAINLYIGQLNAGTTFGQIAAALLGSDEFFLAAGQNKT